jgi:hypothetical protein
LVGFLLGLVVPAAGAEEEPFGFGELPHELDSEVGFGLIAIQPALAHGEKFLLVFVGEDEAVGAESVLGSVSGWSGLCLRARWDRRGDARPCGSVP